MHLAGQILLGHQVWNWRGKPLDLAGRCLSGGLSEEVFVGNVDSGLNWCSLLNMPEGCSLGRGWSERGLVFRTTANERTNQAMKC